MAFLTINWPAVFGAAAAAWIFGAVYYGVFGKAWIAAQGRTLEQCKAEQAGKSAAAKAAPFVISYIAEVIMGWVLYGIFTHIGIFTLRGGILSGAFCWFGFVLTTVTVNNAYAGRRPLLTLIDSVHWLGALVIVGSIVGWAGPK